MILRKPYYAIREYLSLYFLNVVVCKRNLVEAWQVFRRYYYHRLFMKVDILFFFSYLFRSPYNISKRFLKGLQAEHIYAYGETPLTTMDVITREAELSQEDVVFELGCGRGLTVFWMHLFVGCRVVGIEWVPRFVKKAMGIKAFLKISGVDFQCVDMLKADYSEATVIYLYGTSMEDEDIRDLLRNLVYLKKGLKLITVSYPLNNYWPEERFHLDKVFKAHFTWGEAHVFVQRLI